MVAVTLDASARLVMMQFSFSNPNIIPSLVRHRIPETKSESDERKQRSSNGRIAIEPCENVSIEKFARGLELESYVLVDGIYQSRQNQHNPSQMYHMVRFTFSRNEYAEISDHFKQVQPIIRTELQDICDMAFWRVRAFSNPFYKNGVEMGGFRALSFNFEARVPRWLPDGQPVLQRRKDAEGRKIGEPVPIEPAHHLVVLENAVTLLD